MSDSLQPHGLWPTRFLCPRNFPGKNTGVGCLFLLQGIVSTQRSNPWHLLHWQADFFTTEPPGEQYTGTASANYYLCNNPKAVINEEVKTEK